MATNRPHIPRAPYVDPNTNIMYETDNPEFHGWLTKQSTWLKVRTVVRFFPETKRTAVP